MKKVLYILLFLSGHFFFAQENEQRIQNIKNQLETLAIDNPGLTENITTDISINTISLANFLLAISEVHKINITVDPTLNQITIANSFSNVTVTDVLVFLCKEYVLAIDFTGNILSIKKHTTAPKKHDIPIAYSPLNDLISIDAKQDKLYDVFKKIMDETGKNLVFSPGLEQHLITAYIQQVPFKNAMSKLAFANNLLVTTTKDGFFVFESNAPQVSNGNKKTRRQAPRRHASSFYFKIITPEAQRLEVDFLHAPIADIINTISEELGIDVFTATPLQEAGNISFKAKNISFDELLIAIFEAQTKTSKAGNNTNNNGNQLKQFAFKKEANVYFFGTENQLIVQETAIIHLQHRSVALLTDPSGGMGKSTTNNTIDRRQQNNSAGNQYNSYNSPNGTSAIRNTTNQSFANHSNKAEALVNILPDAVKKDLEIKVDTELNSFYVHGPSTHVERFKKLIAKIDQPVPVILIEVMLIEVSNTTAVETGVTWGIGDEAVTTKGSIFPETNITLGASTINKVIGGFKGFGSFNLGKLVPNFYATIKAMESNGNLKIRSTPKLSTLNGHRATFSNGQTSYYAVTQRNIYGTDNPQTSEITNYHPISAALGITIKPLVSGDGQVTLDIFVIQSSFGTRISENAPPDINSREFSSIIRVKDQDIVVLGGLEEQMKNNSGSGVPFLARIPVIKWLFSARKREAKKAKLTVLIKPTIIY